MFALGRQGETLTYEGGVWGRSWHALIALALLAAGCGGGGGEGSTPSTIDIMSEEEADRVLEELWVETEAATETDDGGRSLGFEIESHGWSFANYAANTAQQFSTADAIALFGAEAVCGSTEGGCTPTPAAKEWINMVAQAMSGGVCEGMTVAILDRFLVRTDPGAFDVRKDRLVERSLSRLFAT